MLHWNRNDALFGRQGWLVESVPFLPYLGTLGTAIVWDLPDSPHCHLRLATGYATKERVQLGYVWYVVDERMLCQFCLGLGGWADGGISSGYFDCEQHEKADITAECVR